MPDISKLTKSNPRRQFLKTAAVVAAAMPCAHEPLLMAQNARVAADAPSESATLLPHVSLGKYQVSRLMVGSNPLYGYSHFNRLFSQHMVEWATPEHVAELLRNCWGHGINTWQFSHSERSLADLRRHREEGGQMQWILLSHPEIEDNRALLREVAKLKPIGIVLHSVSAERKRSAGKLEEIRDFLKAVRDTGVMAGLSAHDPALIEEAEERGWETDFYMAAMYYMNRAREVLQKMLGGKAPLGEIYLPDDPPRMCQTIRRTKKSCLCYKVLAAGRLTDSAAQIDQAFQFVLENIKPQDAMIIGMYPRYMDQVTDNAARVRRLLTRA